MLFYFFVTFANPYNRNIKSIQKKLKHGKERNMKVKFPSIFPSCWLYHFIKLEIYGRIMKRRKVTFIYSNINLNIHLPKFQADGGLSFQQTSKQSFSSLNMFLWLHRCNRFVASISCLSFISTPCQVMVFFICSPRSTLSCFCRSTDVLVPAESK